MHGILKNCLVLDLSRLLPGPYCSMILADHGATVIAIEDRRFEKESLPLLDNINRNKKHMTLNLKSNRGKEIFFSMAEKADVIIEGFRPGVTDRLGVGYEDIRKINPKIVYCSVTGYGQNGPLKDQAGHDINFTGNSGVLSMIGPGPDSVPCIPGVQLGDISGGMYAAIGILMALYGREKTGKGEYIDISMTDTLMTMLPLVAGWRWKVGTAPERGNWMLSHRYAWYNVYETADGKHITMGALEPRFWKAVCDCFGVPEFAPLQYDDTRRQEITEYFKKEFLKKTRDEWMAVFGSMDVCVGEVLSIDEAFGGDNAKARDMIVKTDETGEPGSFVIGTPVKFKENPGSIRTPAPKFGENTHEILKEYGFSDQETEELAKDNII
ncbi:MAG: CoA transferase [Desulfobacteraceae bacterium]|nr:CoA transferase [Desulfobacteraceae bacterium]